MFGSWFHSCWHRSCCSPGCARAGAETANGCHPGRDENIVQKVDPLLRDRKYNPIAVRVIIDQAGKVKHIHFLSAFPEQARAITDALLQWKFKPYLRDGRPVEVETGILFGQSPPNFKSPPATVTASTVTR
jgi:hypothetical protein